MDPTPWYHHRRQGVQFCKLLLRGHLSQLKFYPEKRLKIPRSIAQNGPANILVISNTLTPFNGPLLELSSLTNLRFMFFEVEMLLIKSLDLNNRVVIIF